MPTQPIPPKPCQRYAVYSKGVIWDWTISELRREAIEKACDFTWRDEDHQEWKVLRAKFGCDVSRVTVTPVEGSN